MLDREIQKGALFKLPKDFSKNFFRKDMKMGKKRTFFRKYF